MSYSGIAERDKSLEYFQNDLLKLTIPVYDIVIMFY